MIEFDAVLARFERIDARELERWIAERWVRPERRGQAWLFHEVDLARIHLILELRHDLAIDEEAMPLVLHLLDQVYRLRRRLRTLGAAIGAQPQELRQALFASLGEEPPEE
jgi:chaperone modulatory protein CbpM